MSQLARFAPIFRIQNPPQEPRPFPLSARLGLQGPQGKPDLGVGSWLKSPWTVALVNSRGVTNTVF